MTIDGVSSKVHNSVYIAGMQTLPSPVHWVPQIVEACWATRAANGGLLDVNTLLRMVNKRRGRLAEEASLDDVVSAAWGCTTLHLQMCLARMCMPWCGYACLSSSK